MKDPAMSTAAEQRSQEFQALRTTSQPPIFDRAMRARHHPPGDCTTPRSSAAMSNAACSSTRGC